MPFHNVDSTSTTLTALVVTTSYDYNLTRSPSTNPIHGLSVQVVYPAGTFSFTISLQCSNDGTNFADIASTSTAIVNSAGNTMYDLGTPNYKILRVLLTRTSGTLTATLNFNGNNLD